MAPSRFITRGSAAGRDGAWRFVAHGRGSSSRVGESYAARFTESTLPALLAPGNLPTLARSLPTRGGVGHPTPPLRRPARDRPLPPTREGLRDEADRDGRSYFSSRLPLTGDHMVAFR